MEHLKAISLVVYLCLPYEELKERLGSLSQRGVVLKPGETLRELYEERSALYEKYADVTVDTSRMSIQQAAEEILRRYKSES